MEMLSGDTGGRLDRSVGLQTIMAGRNFFKKKNVVKFSSFESLNDLQMFLLKPETHDCEAAL